MLECIQVQKSYGGHPVIVLPSLQLTKGIYWLKGGNGSGKTTFLRLVSGLLPFQGDILLDGHSLRKTPLPYRRKISWADAEPLYPAFLSGQELVSFYQSVRKAPWEQVDWLIDLFRLRPYWLAPIGTYSSGMTKKLSLVLAFIGSPSLIALDEPLVTLDQEAIPALYMLIRKSYSERGTGFLISSHQDIAAGALPDERLLTFSGNTIRLSDPITHTTRTK